MPCKLGSSHSVTPALHPLTTHRVLTAYNTRCRYQAVVLGKGDPRQGLTQNGGGLPTLTNPGLHTKNTMRLTCADAYQTLPRSVLAVRNPLVFLAWSTNAYHTADLALPPFYCVITTTYHPPRSNQNTQVDLDSIELNAGPEATATPA